MDGIRRLLCGGGAADVRHDDLEGVRLALPEFGAHRVVDLPDLIRRCQYAVVEVAQSDVHEWARP